MANNRKRLKNDSTGSESEPVDTDVKGIDKKLLKLIDDRVKMVESKFRKQISEKTIKLRP